MWIINGFLWLVFFIACVLLTIIVLLQESKGGGLAEAFGGTGAETFGVKTGGVHRFTLLLATVVLVSGVLIHGLRNTGSTRSLPQQPQVQPGAPGVPGGGAPGGAPGAPGMPGGGR